MSADQITIALSKGRIFEETLPLLKAAGIVPQDDPEASRKLIIATSRPEVRLIIVRASDVPTYVQYGAVPNGFDYEAAVRRGARLRVATKYIQTAREHFAAKGMHVDLIKLYGSMELAPLTGLSDAIVDLVSSGNTLKANNLKAVEEIFAISSRLIVNRAALKLKHAQVQPMLDAFAAAVAKGRAEAA
jgi:ATP phosphoribosyltransferase